MEQVKTFILYTLLVAFALSLPTLSGEALAFTGAACGSDCTSCHSLTKEEARKLLRLEDADVTIDSIGMSPVKGLWQVEATIKDVAGDKEIIAYMDFAKKYLVQGRFIELERIAPPQKQVLINTDEIPLDGAIVMGDAKAAKKVIVFDDPDCPYCRKLHEEIKKIVAERTDIAFFIKLYPLPMHKEAYAKSKSIVCEGSLALLDDAMSGKTLPEATCDTTEVDDNIKLADKFGINGTPGIILPNGLLVPGYVEGEVLIKMIDNNS